MGTSAFIVTFYNGYYITRSNKYDSAPKDFGVGLLADIPTNPEEFKEWLDWKRKRVEEKVAEWESFPDRQRHNMSYSVDTEENARFPVDWHYTFDLDLLIFAVNQIPLFRLDSMPSPEDFINHFIDRQKPAYIDLNKQHKYILSLLGKPPPTVSAGVLESYTSSSIEVMPLADVIESRKDSSPAERCRIRILEMITDSYCYVIPDMAGTRFPALRSRDHITTRMSKVVRSLLEWFFEPLLILPSEPNLKSDNPPMDEFWWPRPHICVTFDTHLADEDNYKAAVMRILAQMKAQTGIETVYGAITSFCHIIIISYNKKNQICRHTPAMDFARGVETDQYLFEFTSDGIAALIGLVSRNYPNYTQDLIACCHRNFDLTSRTHNEIQADGLVDNKDEISSLSLSVDSTSWLLRLSSDLLLMIGEHLSLKSLLAYAAASVQTAQAVEVLLYRPYVANFRLDCPIDKKIVNQMSFKAFDLEQGIRTSIDMAPQRYGDSISGLQVQTPSFMNGEPVYLGIYHHDSVTNKEDLLAES